MSFKSVLFILLICSLFSCSKQKYISDFENRGDFLSYVEKMNPANRKVFLSEIASTLDSSLKTVKNFEIYYSFSFGLSSGNEKEIKWDTVNWDNLDIEESYFFIPSKDSTLSTFESLKKSIYFTQKFKLPNSEFEIASDEEEIDDNINIEYKEFYKDAKHIDSTAIGIQPITQIKANINYKIVSTYDSLIITANSKDVTYKGYQLDIDTITDQGIEIDIPIRLYTSFLESRGKTPNNKLIKTNSYSFSPFWGFRADYQEQIKETIDLLTKISSDTASDMVMQELTANFNDNMFGATKKLSYYESTLLKNIKELLENEDSHADVFESIKKLRKLIESNVEYIGPVKQRLSIHYPYAIKDFIFYFSESEETYNHEQLFPIKQDEHLTYNLYYDNKSQKYGVIDSLGNIIIEAKYEDLETSENENYFFDRKDSIEYFLNAQSKKFEPLQKGYRLHDKIGRLSILKNSKDQFGIFQDGKEFIPFKYNNITSLSDFILAKYTIRGREIIDIYSKNGELYKTPDIIREAIETKNNDLIIRNNQHKYGLMNPKGEIVIPIFYNNLEETFSNNYLYVSNDETSFILTIANKKIDFPPETGYRSSMYIGDNLFGYRDAYSRKYGYFNEKNEIIIKPQYEEITAFQNGRAFVQTSNGDILLIDQHNAVLKVIAKNVKEDIYNAFAEDKTPLFLIDDQPYDINGIPSNFTVYKNY